MTVRWLIPCGASLDVTSGEQILTLVCEAVADHDGGHHSVIWWEEVTTPGPAP